jgi:hypothetical protein
VCLQLRSCGEEAMCWHSHLLIGEEGHERE